MTVDPAWTAAWVAAVRKTSADGNLGQAERAAQRAIQKFINAPKPPGTNAMRGAIKQVATGLRLISDGVDILRAGAASTPSGEHERRAVLDLAHHDVERHVELDPSGPAWGPFSHMSSDSEWERAAIAVEESLEFLAANRLPRSRPNAPSAAFDRLIRDLAHAFTLATGNAPSAAGNADPGYKSPFVHFVTALWCQASSRPEPKRKKIDGALRRSATVAPIQADGREQFGRITDSPKHGRTLA